MSDFRLFKSSDSSRRAGGQALILAVIVGMLAGCGVKQVTVTQSVPVPVAKQHAKHIGLYMQEAFRNYTYSEKLPSGGDWSVDIGEANVSLFEKVFAGMFRQVSELNALKPAAGVQAMVQPEILDFQFSTPKQNQTEFFEAWIKYQVSFYDSQGKKLAQWPVKAYGRSESRLLNKEQSLRDATEVALRDAAAAMVLGFDRHPAVRSFLYGELGDPTVVRQEQDPRAG